MKEFELSLCQATYLKGAQYIIVRNRVKIEVQTKRSYRPSRRNAIRQHTNQVDRPLFLPFLTPLTHTWNSLKGSAGDHLTLAACTQYCQRHFNSTSLKEN